LRRKSPPIIPSSGITAGKDRPAPASGRRPSPELAGKDTGDVLGAVTDILGERYEAAGGHAWAGGGFDAAFVAVGAHTGRRAYIPADDFCKGYGLCVAECPCGSIEMQPEP
jgi:hypothetical protein